MNFAIVEAPLTVALPVMLLPLVNSVSPPEIVAVPTLPLNVDVPPLMLAVVVELVEPNRAFPP